MVMLTFGTCIAPLFSPSMSEVGIDFLYSVALAANFTTSCRRKWTYQHTMIAIASADKSREELLHSRTFTRSIT